MSDLIDRSVAVDALKEHRALFCDNTPDTFSKLSYAEKSRVDELDMAIATLINLPSAQPERKTGRWILVNDNNGQHFVCEFCGEWKYHQKQKFCGECGARMVEVEHE